MKLYRLSCTTCGAVSPPYKKRVSGRHHDCKYPCRTCGWRKAGYGRRGLCDTCDHGGSR